MTSSFFEELVATSTPPPPPQVLKKEKAMALDLKKKQCEVLAKRRELRQQIQKDWSGDREEAQKEGGMPMWGKILLFILLIGLLAWLIWSVTKKKKVANLTNTLRTATSNVIGELAQHGGSGFPGLMQQPSSSSILPGGFGAGQGTTAAAIGTAALGAAASAVKSALQPGQTRPTTGTAAVAAIDGRPSSTGLGTFSAPSLDNLRVSGGPLVSSRTPIPTDVRPRMTNGGSHRHASNSDDLMLDVRLKPVSTTTITNGSSGGTNSGSISYTSASLASAEPGSLASLDLGRSYLRGENK